MKLWLLFFCSALLFGRSIPEGYLSPIPADVLTKSNVEVHFGTLHFDDAVPTPDSKQKIQNEFAYMQLSQIYFKNHEAVWLKLLRDELTKLSITPNKTLAITASALTSKVLWPKLDPQTIYSVAVLDTRSSPIILQLPDRLSYGVVLDHFGPMKTLSALHN